MKDISIKLKHLRLQKGLTLNALANRAGEVFYVKLEEVSPDKSQVDI